MTHPEKRTRQRGHWLQAGALAAGLGAAYVAGSGIAYADDGGASAQTHASSGNAKESGSGVGHSARQSASAKRAQAAAARGNPSQPVAQPVVRAAATRAQTVVVGADTTKQTAVAAAAETAPRPAAVASTAAVDVPALAAQPAPAQYPAKITQDPVSLRSIVSDVSRWTRLSLLPPDTPIPATPLPDLLGGLWVGVRKIHYHLANSNPRATYTLGQQDPNTGAITGAVVASDADGDQVTYTVVDGPSHGTLDFSPDGTFSYKPDPGYAHQGGPDVFTVAVSDDNPANPWHLHGLADLFGLVKPRTIGVGLYISPLNKPPVVNQPSTSFTLWVQQFPSISGTVQATDPDGDPLTYTVTTQGQHGTATVDADGNYTYTSSDPFTEGFTITVSDGRGGEATQTVGVNKFLTAIIVETPTVWITLPPNAGDSVLDYINPDGTTGSASQIVVSSAANANSWLVTVTPDGKKVLVKPRVGAPRSFDVPTGQFVTVKQDNSGTYGVFANSALITLFDPAAWG